MPRSRWASAWICLPDALKSLLTLRVFGRTHVIINQNNPTIGFEQYRYLAQRFEPDTEARNLEDLQKILRPGAAGNMEEFIKKYLASKAMYEARISGADPC